VDPWHPGTLAERLTGVGPRPKDEADFANVRPRLTAAQRAWLGDALSLIHPGHEWLRRL
jgi:hypothetical protein